MNMAASKDRALLAILGSNALTLALALAQGWGLLHLLWPFFIQSLVIGVLARRRILALGEFQAEGVLVNGRPLPSGERGKRMIANFFAMHFGIFHLVYLIFLIAFTLLAGESGMVPVHSDGEVVEVAMGRIDAFDWLVFALIGIAFWRSHALSQREHLAADLAGRPSIGKLMFLPYLRVLPMHFMIVFGMLLGGGPWGLALFVALKTAADIGMHRLEHALLRRGVVAS